MAAHTYDRGSVASFIGIMVEHGMASTGFQSTDRQEYVPCPEHQERDGGKLEQDKPLRVLLIDLKFVLESYA